jgi:membrane protein implicated in regulation of membrane protease activity
MVIEPWTSFQWHWWAGLGHHPLMIAEIFVPGFFLLCLGYRLRRWEQRRRPWAPVPACSSSPSAAFSLICLLHHPPGADEAHVEGPDVRTNVDALVGQRGKVTQDFDPGLRLGACSVAGDDWRAECNDKPLRVGDLVEVVRVESNTLIVKPLDTA